MPVLYSLSPISQVKFVSIPMKPGSDLVFEAIAFAARAHRHQQRKDGITPYVSHVFRVAMVVATVFNVQDPPTLAVGVLHDTLEDTTTDYEDLSERFGDQIASDVAALSKDMRLPEEERERVYIATLAQANKAVLLCKLADLYDNLSDSRHLSPSGQLHTAQRSRLYLEALRGKVQPDTQQAFDIVETRLHKFESINKS